jgi:hypothetical protein
MQPNPIPGQTNEARDRRNQQGVLARVLELHPTHLTLEELLLELGTGVDGGPTREHHERAIRDLVAAGLIRRDGDSILPTRAALSFEEISR